MPGPPARRPGSAAGDPATPAGRTGRSHCSVTSVMPVGEPGPLGLGLGPWAPAGDRTGVESRSSRRDRRRPPGRAAAPRAGGPTRPRRRLRLSRASHGTGSDSVGPLAEGRAGSRSPAATDDSGGPGPPGAAAGAAHNFGLSRHLAAAERAASLRPGAWRPGPIPAPGPARDDSELTRNLSLM